MTQSYSRSSQFNSTTGSIIHEDDQAFSDVIAAISEGKYSWACVLMLRSAGYNPLHYMPYRTYNRIIKANLNLGKKHPKKQAVNAPATTTQTSSTYTTQSNLSSKRPVNLSRFSPGATHSQRSNSSSSDCKISDLPHLDTASEASRNTIKGGWSNAASDLSNWWSSVMSGR